MQKKIKRIIVCVVILCMALTSISMDSKVMASDNINTQMGDEVNENSVESEGQSQNDTLEKTDPNIQGEDETNETTIESNNGENNKIEETEIMGEEEDLYNRKSVLVNYLSIDKPYLETPNIQNIVLSFGEGSEKIDAAKII